MDTHAAPRKLKKRLTKHGNSLALVIDKPILELLGIDERTELSVSTDGRSLVVSPSAPAADDAKFERALAHVNRRYAKPLKRLAGR